MNWTTVVDVLAAACFLGGASFVLLAAIGVLRFTDVVTRMHAGTKPQVLGLMMTLLGLALTLRDAAVLGILVLAILFQLLTTPVASHMIGRAAFRSGQVPTDDLVVDELSGLLDGDGRPQGSEPAGP